MNRRGFFRALLGGLAALVLPLPRGAGQAGTNPIFSGELGVWSSVEIHKRWAQTPWLELPEQIYFSKFLSQDEATALGVKGDIITFTKFKSLSAPEEGA